MSNVKLRRLYKDDQTLVSNKKKIRHKNTQKLKENVEMKREEKRKEKNIKRVRTEKKKKEDEAVKKETVSKRQKKMMKDVGKNKKSIKKSEKDIRKMLMTKDPNKKKVAKNALVTVEKIKLKEKIKREKDERKRVKRVKRERMERDEKERERVKKKKEERERVKREEEVSQIIRHKIGVFIDGDNVNYKSIEIIQQEIKKYGDIISLNVYGDFTHPQLARWIPICKTSDMNQVQCENIPKKNSTDFKLIIGVMIYLYEHREISLYCIISNDRDFVSIVKEIQNKGKEVYCFGDSSTTHNSLKTSCDRFIDTQRLLEPNGKQKTGKGKYRYNRNDDQSSSANGNRD